MPLLPDAQSRARQVAPESCNAPSAVEWVGKVDLAVILGLGKECVLCCQGTNVGSWYRHRAMLRLGMRARGYEWLQSKRTSCSFHLVFPGAIRREVHGAWPRCRVALGVWMRRECVVCGESHRMPWGVGRVVARRDRRVARCGESVHTA